MAGATRNRFKGELIVSGLSEEEPVGRAGADLTPFLEAIDKSWEGRSVDGNKATGVTLGITVPLAARTITETRLRDAAKERGLGVSVTFVVPGEPRAAKYDLGTDRCRAIFNARTRKAAPPKPAAAGDAPPANGAAKPAAKKAAGMPTPTGSR